MNTHRKKLIEVALPLDAINAASAKEKSISHGHPSTLHLWWSRKPLATARAVIFSQLVDDPSSNPDLFPRQADQERERLRLFGLIEKLVKWENTTNEKVLEEARVEIRKSWRRTCAENANHPRARELFDPDNLPAFCDPFAGGGALPLEAQRLGLEAQAGDLNPVAVLINKALIDVPAKFTNVPPANPEARRGSSTNNTSLIGGDWKGAQGLAEDVRYYGQWMRDEAEKRIGHLYPKIQVTAEMAGNRPDLKRYQGRELTVIAWQWVRTARSPNPAFADVEVPLAPTFMLSTRKGKEAYVEPVINGRQYEFTVKVGSPPVADSVRAGTKAGGSGKPFFCLMSGTTMPFDYLRSEAKCGRMGARLMAIVAEGDRERVYLPPTPEHVVIAEQIRPLWAPDTKLPERALGFRVQEYNMTTWRDLFTPRQLVALTTLSDLVPKTIERVKQDTANLHKLTGNDLTLRHGGTGPTAYAEAVGAYLGLCVSRQANRSSILNFWDPAGAKVQQVFAKQTLAMIWNFVESNPFSNSSGNFTGQVGYLSNVVYSLPCHNRGSSAFQMDAATQSSSQDKVVSTDPPYYHYIGYADLSDFFYIWLRRSIRPLFPDLFSTLTVPKAEELIATPYRHGNMEKADEFFLVGMTKAIRRLVEQCHPGFPVSIYYAFKQSETKGRSAGGRTGWESFLDAVIRSGFTLTGTWPMRTEYTGNLKKGTNALASSIVLVCRRRSKDAPLATRREFVSALRTELPTALAHLQSGNIAPVDLAQAAIGPGMAVFTRYSKVLDAQGNRVSVGDALALINQTLDEVLTEQEGEFDPDTRWALAWFEQQGFVEGEYGVAETLSKAKNTSIDGIVEGGILTSRGGKVRLLRPGELAGDWDPTADNRLTVWEAVHYLVHALESSGDSAAAELVHQLGGLAETARELAYRLYTICERKNRAEEASSYNGLVQSWPEIAQLARERAPAEQGELFRDTNPGSVT